jgi:hypothetical protein
MKKFLATLGVLTVVATPAFAQSFCTCDGTGNVLTFTHNPITLPQSAAIAAPQTGQNAFAMVSAPSSPSNSNSPAAAGGGSLGYNEMLRNF